MIKEKTCLQNEKKVYWYQSLKKVKKRTCQTIKVFKLLLLSSVLKPYIKILAEEVRSTEICEEQQGFRNNRSAIDAIFIIRKITKSYTAFMCFINLTQAFDRVRLTYVIILLHKRSMHPNIIRIIEELNTENYIYVTKYSEYTGIRQEG